MSDASLLIEKASRYESQFGVVQDDFPMVLMAGLSPRRPKKPVGYEPEPVEEHFPMPMSESTDLVGDIMMSPQGQHSMHLLEYAGDVAIASML